MKYIKLLLLFLIMHVVNTNAMDELINQKEQPDEHVNKELQAKIKMPPALYIPAEFCVILKEKIFTIPFFLSQCSSLNEAGKFLCNLAVVNSYLNFVINNSGYTRVYNQQLSDQFGCSNLETAKHMRTYGANIFCMIQDGFRPGAHVTLGMRKNGLDGWGRNDYKYHEYLVKQGFDVNCTYDNRKYPTLLLQFCSWSTECFSRIEWLLNKGANINAVCSSGNNACMLTLLCGDTSFLREFVKHKDFKPNHQNYNGETILHLLFPIINSMRNNADAEKVCDLISEMLKKGANPLLADKKGVTSLAVAGQIKNKEVRESIIELLKKAEIKFNSPEK